MTEQEFLTIISTLAREIEMLKFENSRLEKINHSLAEKLGNIGLEIIRKENEIDAI